MDTRQLEEKYKETNCNQNSVVKAFQYACLKSCLNIQTTPGNEYKLLVPLNKAKLAVSRLCQNLNMDNCQNIYKVLEKLHTFNDIEDYFSVRTKRAQISELLQKWDLENLPQFIDFKHIEALSSQRVLILEHAAKSHTNSLNEIVSLQIQYASKYTQLLDFVSYSTQSSMCLFQMSILVRNSGFIISSVNWNVVLFFLSLFRNGS